MIVSLLAAVVVAGCRGREPAEHAAAKQSTPLYRVAHTSTPPTLDGNLDEEVWRRAPATPAFVDTMTGAAGLPRAWAKLLWDAQFLYVAVSVEDELIVSPFTRHDDQLWQRDCVEIFLDPDGDGHNYFEIEVSPLNVVFDTRYDKRRRPQPYGHVTWQSQTRSAARVDGTPNDPQKDKGYQVEFAVPFASLAVGAHPTPTPTADDRWRVNLYVLDWAGTGLRGSSWSPPLVGDFHVPARFGTLVFEGPKAAAPK